MVRTNASLSGLKALLSVESDSDSAKEDCDSDSEKEDCADMGLGGSSLPSALLLLRMFDKWSCRIWRRFVFGIQCKSDKFMHRHFGTTFDRVLQTNRNKCLHGQTLSMMFNVNKQIKRFVHVWNALC